VRAAQAGETAGGFADAWSGGPLSCCHANDLHDPNPTLTKRIDLILTRGGFETVGSGPDVRPLAVRPRRGRRDAAAL